MQKNKILHGILTVLCVGTLTFLFFVQAKVVLQPISVRFLPTDIAFGYASTLSGLCNSLRGYWKFDESSGTSAIDSSQNANTGILTNGPTTTTNTASGFTFYNPRSLIFDGDNDNVTVVDSTSLDLTTSGSISVWIRPGNIRSETQPIVMKGLSTGAAISYGLYMGQYNSGAKFTFFVDDGGSWPANKAVTTYMVQTGSWLHIAGTWNTSGVRIYYSGSLVTASSGSVSAYNSLGLSIANVAGMEYYTGVMDDVRIYNRALTGGQILTLARRLDIYSGCTCGNASVEDPEECDDGDTDNTDACTNFCLSAECGDGYTQSSNSETCDNGSSNSNSVADACRTTCVSADCGDGVVDTGETCDDADSDNTDSCTTSCRGPSCGDGYIQPDNNEQCEPPNTVTCAANCIGTGSGGGSNKKKSSSAVSNKSYAQKSSPPDGCGDRILDTKKGEQCDDGALNGVGTCSYECKRLYCGDAIVSPQIVEECEPVPKEVVNGEPVYEQEICDETGEICTVPVYDEKFNRWNGGCQRRFVPKCEEQPAETESGHGASPSHCGNGIVDEGEQCDSGGICVGGTGDGAEWTDAEAAASCVTGGGVAESANDDGCSDQCKLEICGDGSVQTNGADGMFETSDDEECDNGSVCDNAEQTPCATDADCSISLLCEFTSDGTRHCGGDLAKEVCESDFDCSYFSVCRYSHDVDAECTDQCKRAVCGNNIKEGMEQCDDGNVGDDDGCSSTCQIEKQEEEELFSFCGDGEVNNEEECDDGNESKGDGCSESCLKEISCGDGTVDAGEQCDDRNAQDGDGCNAQCKTEAAPKPAAPPEKVCGDGTLDSNEECDNGKDNSDVIRNACRTNCKLPVCGDFIIDPGEACDSGTSNSDRFPDTCRRSCHLPWCGDNIVDTNEECDGTPNCMQNCMEKKLPQCGNGLLEQGEECDDRNQKNDDGCTKTCIKEAPKVPEPMCGNGLLEKGEQCDDANLKNADGCSKTCTREEESRITLRLRIAVRDQQGNPLAGVPLTLRSEPKHGRTDPQGFVEFDAVELGDHVLTVDSTAFNGQTSEYGLRIQKAAANTSLIEVVVSAEGKLPITTTVSTGELHPGMNIISAQIALSVSPPPLPSFPNIHYVASVMPMTIPAHAPQGETGPAVLLAIAGGAAAGIGWQRRRRK